MRKRIRIHMRGHLNEKARVSSKGGKKASNLKYFISKMDLIDKSD